MSFAKEVLTIPIKDWNKIGLLFVLQVVSFVTYKRKNRQSLNLSMALVREGNRFFHIVHCSHDYELWLTMVYELKVKVIHKR